MPKYREMSEAQLKEVFDKWLKHRLTRERRVPNQDLAETLYCPFCGKKAVTAIEGGFQCRDCGINFYLEDLG